MNPSKALPIQHNKARFLLSCDGGESTGMGSVDAGVLLFIIHVACSLGKYHRSIMLLPVQLCRQFIHPTGVQLKKAVCVVLLSVLLTACLGGLVAQAGTQVNWLFSDRLWG